MPSPARSEKCGYSSMKENEDVGLSHGCPASQLQLLGGSASCRIGKQAIDIESHPHQMAREMKVLQAAQLWGQVQRH